MASDRTVPTSNGALATIQSTVGIPSINADGMHWSTVDYAVGVPMILPCPSTTLSKSRVENIKPLSPEYTHTPSTNSHTSILTSRIESVEINTIIHHDEDKYDTKLGGTVYPIIALTNDWLSVGEPMKHGCYLERWTQRLNLQTRP